MCWMKICFISIKQTKKLMKNGIKRHWRSVKDPTQTTSEYLDPWCLCLLVYICVIRHGWEHKCNWVCNRIQVLLKSRGPDPCYDITSQEQTTKCISNPNTKINLVFHSIWIWDEYSLQFPVCFESVKFFQIKNSVTAQVQVFLYILIENNQFRPTSIHTLSFRYIVPKWTHNRAFMRSPIMEQNDLRLISMIVNGNIAARVITIQSVDIIIVYVFTIRFSYAGAIGSLTCNTWCRFRLILISGGVTA